jgi:glycosyltransferase involved in cell wall biosynthesis
MTKKLLIIVSDYISSWIEKGEVVPRYYNPGNLFDEVHIMMTNDDKPDPKLVQPMVGNAKLFIYNYPEPVGFFKKTLGWHPLLMKKWGEGAVHLAKKINPDLIRCYGLHLSVFLGAQIKKRLNIPLFTSLHGNPDVDYFRGRLAKNWKDKIIGKCQDRLERFLLGFLDHIIAVYSPIEPYLEKHKYRAYSIIHNTVGLGSKKKENFSINPKKIKLLCVGRQTYLQKDPSNIIKAVSQMENVYLTLVGDGDLHDNLVSLANRIKCYNRLTFIKSMDNKRILTLMRDSDIYIYHSINYEISKSCIEAALVGVPIILNDRNGNPAQELKDAGFYLVEDTSQGYKAGIDKVINDEIFRMQLAKNSHQYALQYWAPEITEKKVVDLYKSFITQ